jgi:cytochrome P450
VSLWRYLRLFRADILSAQPARLYRAWMAEFRTPFFRSYMINDPKLLTLVLKDRPDDFPKSDRIGAGLRPLLGNSVFLTNGEVWKRQRRIIDPAFEGGRLRDTFPAMWAAGEAAVERIEGLATGKPVEIEEETSHGCGRRYLSHAVFDPDRARSGDPRLCRIQDPPTQPADPKPCRVFARAQLDAPVFPVRDPAHRPVDPGSDRAAGGGAGGVD